MKRIARLIAGLGAFGLLASGLSSAPADAVHAQVTDGQRVQVAPSATAGTATIERSLYLTGNGTTATAKMPYGGPRRVLLAEGEYRWAYELRFSVSLAFSHAEVRSIVGGWYFWRCYLHGTGKRFPANTYTMDCLLDPDDGLNTQPYRFPASGAISLPLQSGTWAWTNSLTQL